VASPHEPKLQFRSVLLIIVPLVTGSSPEQGHLRCELRKLHGLVTS